MRYLIFEPLFERYNPLLPFIQTIELDFNYVMKMAELYEEFLNVGVTFV